MVVNLGYGLTVDSHFIKDGYFVPDVSSVMELLQFEPLDAKTEFHARELIRDQYDSYIKGKEEFLSLFTID